MQRGSICPKGGNVGSSTVPHRAKLVDSQTESLPQVGWVATSDSVATSVNKGWQNFLGFVKADSQRPTNSSSRLSVPRNFQRIFVVKAGQVVGYTTGCLAGQINKPLPVTHGHFRLSNENLTSALGADEMCPLAVKLSHGPILSCPPHAKAKAGGKQKGRKPFGPDDRLWLPSGSCVTEASPIAA